MGRSQRDKGARWERELAKRLDAALPVTCKRSGFTQSQDAHGAPDVDTGGVFWVEAKVGARPPVWPALEQAKEGAPEGVLPVACIKRDRTVPIVVMELDDWLQLASVYAELRGAWPGGGND